jgi:hypothetical protein
MLTYNSPGLRSAETWRPCKTHPRVKCSPKGPKLSPSSPLLEMSDIPRHISPDERVIQPTSPKLQACAIAPPYQTQGAKHKMIPPNDLTKIMHYSTSTSPNLHTPPTYTPSYTDPSMLPRIVAALNDGDHNIAALVSTLPNLWREIN